jgi:hypothetical protein
MECQFRRTQQCVWPSPPHTRVRRSHGLLLGVLYLFPILVHIVTNAGWQRHLQQIAPMNAGLAIQKTTGFVNGG